MIGRLVRTFLVDLNLARAPGELSPTTSKKDQPPHLQFTPLRTFPL